MTFKIEFSDVHFRLISISPSGQEEYGEVVSFCEVSSVVVEGGTVYGAYLRGNEPEMDEIENHPDPDMISLPARSVKVFNVTQWPALAADPGAVTLIAAIFPEYEEEESEDEDEGDVIEVEPIS